MPAIPRDQNPDATVGLMLDPYGYIGKCCRRLGTDVFRTRLLLQRTICLSGPRAAELFYDPARFIRQGAAPGRMVYTLLGPGGVQSLDGEAHRHRKAMFLSVLAPERVGRLVELADDEWTDHARRWAGAGRVVLYDEARSVLTRAVCAWAGVPLEEKDVAHRVAQLTALFESAGAVGPKHWWGRFERWRADRWAAGLIVDVRARRLRPAEDTALAVLAGHRDHEGKPLDARTAGVELLNVLRPVVAVAVYITFVAHALHRSPEGRARADEPGYADRFVQEVRRLYPFFPSIATAVRESFAWDGYEFPKGTRVMLDLYGTSHDRRTWPDPDDFRPDRFRDREPGPFEFVPQGGGDHATGHRCAGEWATVALMKGALDFLTHRIEYVVPAQDLTINVRRLPALPRSRFVIDGVRQPSAVG
jgi:fatty-acid peroxygenase